MHQTGRKKEDTQTILRCFLSEVLHIRFFHDTTSSLSSLLLWHCVIRFFFNFLYVMPRPYALRLTILLFISWRVFKISFPTPDQKGNILWYCSYHTFLVSPLLLQLILQDVSLYAPKARENFAFFSSEVIRAG